MRERPTSCSKKIRDCYFSRPSGWAQIGAGLTLFGVGAVAGALQGPNFADGCGGFAPGPGPIDYGSSSSTCNSTTGEPVIKSTPLFIIATVLALGSGLFLVASGIATLCVSRPCSNRNEESQPLNSLRLSLNS